MSKIHDDFTAAMRDAGITADTSKDLIEIGPVLVKAGYSHEEIYHALLALIREKIITHDGRTNHVRFV